MKIKIESYWLPLLLLGMLFACSKNPAGPEFQKEICIFGFLHGGEPLSAERAIHIAYTQPVTRYYDADQAAVRNAAVTLEEQASGVLWILQEAPARPGYYYNNNILIQPEATYKLTVKTAEKTLTASTSVPAALVLQTELQADSANAVQPKDVGYRYPIQIECENPEQIIIVDMYCNEEYQNAEYIKPFSDKRTKPENQDEYDGGQNGEPRHITVIMRYKELAAQEFGGSHVVYWYGSMLVFYGSNTLQVLAIDDNYHHYLYLEHPELNGGIQGGIGVFGSVCGSRYQLQVAE